jgi:hypothetical protein
MKRLVIAFLSFVIVLTGLQPSHSMAVPDKNQESFGINIAENGFLGTMPPVIFGTSDPNDQSTYRICKGFADSVCVATTNLFAFNHLPACSVAVTINCISAVWAVDPSGKRIDGTFKRSVADDSTTNYEANPAIGLPLGKGMGSIWDFPGVVNSGGTTSYLVNAMLNGWVVKPAGVSTPTKNFSWGQLDSGIIPVKEVFGPEYRMISATDATSNPSKSWGSNSGAGSQYKLDCALVENGVCEERQEFPAGYRFGYTISLTHHFNGWFHGRVYQPVVTIKDNSQQVISIEAEPVVVPSLVYKLPVATMPKNVYDYIFSGSAFSQGGGALMPGNSGEQSFEQAALFLPLVKDTATSSKSYWAIKTLDSWSDPVVQKCSGGDSSLSGLVTTNSLVYGAGPPTFNKEAGSLDYKLLSPHFEAGGKVATGTYDLILKSSVARCVYGFTNAPLKATIEIVSNDGNSQLASSVMTEKDGWLTLSAKGFTFSNPTIKVKLTQDAPAVVVPAPAPSVAPSTPIISAAKPPVKQVTITCVKGKITKKVTATKPVCPSGYKKK